MQGPFANVSRNPNINLIQWENDMQAVYNLARMWYFTGDAAYAQKSRDILIAWANTQTSFTGVESGLDLGGMAYRYAGGAEILRSTWSGWTQTDTDQVKALFNIYWNSSSGPLGPANKGTLQLSAMVSIAVFNDDLARLETTLDEFLNDMASGLTNTAANGEAGETGRDAGHSYGQWLGLVYTAEVFHKQGIDVYSLLNNRLLAVGEYWSRYNLGVNTPYTPMGTTDYQYWTISNNTVGWPAEAAGFLILQNAYAFRKGMDTPYINQKVAQLSVNMDNFMWARKYGQDTTTATLPKYTGEPAVSSVGSGGLTNISIGNPLPVGGASYNNGTWTVTGGYNGGDPWGSGSETHHFAYKALTGDCTIIAKVTSVSNPGAGNAKAGVMIRSTLANSGATKAWIALTPSTNYESSFAGWTSMFGGSNWEKKSAAVPAIPYWIKIVRVGKHIGAFTSPDGTTWATIVSGEYGNLGNTAYVGLFVSSQNTGTACTATFTDVSMTGGNGTGPISTPAAPFAIYADPGNNSVPLRWSESFGATSYKVKRSTTAGGPYATIATVSTSSYVDHTAENGTTYHYVVSAVNNAGESANTTSDTTTPQAIPSLFSNLALRGGTASAYAQNTTTETSAKAFDGQASTKWYSGDNAGSTGWLKYDFGAGNNYKITRYTLVSGNDVPGRDPKSWQFQASSNGTSWTTLDSRSNEAFANRNQSNTYDFTNNTSYRYYRLNITQNNGANAIQLADLGLWGYADVALSTPRTVSAITQPGNKIVLNWSGNTGAATYTIRRSTTSGGFFTVIGTSTATTFTDITGIPGTTYYYTITAINRLGETPYSAEVIATSPAGSINGRVFEDRNTDGLKQAGEPSFSNTVIYLDINNNAIFDPGEITTTTDANGDYSLDNLPAGIYSVRQIVPINFISVSSPGVVTLSSDTSSQINQNFTNFPATFAGSSDDDSFSILENGSRYEIHINGQLTYSINQTLASNLTFSGNGGNDLLWLQGTDQTDEFAITSIDSISHDAGVFNFSGFESFQFQAGSFAVDASLGAISLDVVDAYAFFTQPQQLSSLDVSDGSLVITDNSNPSSIGLDIGSVSIDNSIIRVAANGGFSGVCRFLSLAITGTGKLDLADNDLIIDYGSSASSYSMIRTQVKSGLALLDGTGYGITSSTVDAQTLNGSMLAVVDDGDPTIGGGITSVSGYALPNPSTSVIIKFTWFGDSNLDGRVDGADYALIDTGFTASGSLNGWVFGDYDYHDSVEGLDYALIDTGFISQSSIL